MKLKQYRYLIIGIFASLIIHAVVFFSLLLLTEKPLEKKKEKEIFIRILPAPEIKKITEKPKVKKERRKGIPKKEVKKREKKEKKTIQKQIKKKTVKRNKKQKPLKEIKPQERLVKQKTIKKEEKKPPLKKTVEKKEIKKEIPSENLVKKKKKVEIPKIEVSKEIEDILDKEIKIPEDMFGLRGKKEKTKIAKDEKTTKKEKKVVEDYLKYIKQEFEKNKFYPLRARKLGIEGTVIIRFTVLPDGTIDMSTVEIVYSDSPILSYGAKRIFEKIRKIPKKPPGEKKLTVEIPIEYILIEVY